MDVLKFTHRKQLSEGDYMKIENGCTYVCENGYLVTLERNQLPYYKFSCVGASFEGKIVDCTEKFTEDGIAYHNDCVYNIVRKVG